MQKICPKCGISIAAQNYSRHLNRCDGSGLKCYVKQTPPDNLDCPYCGKECKNLNSYKQHTCRCRNNPERKSFSNFSNYIVKYRKGRTAQDCEEIAKQVSTTRDKYANGYASPCKGRRVVFEHLYKDHNDEEIRKWLDWLKVANPSIEYLPVKYYWEGYEVISSKGIIFQQDYVIAQILGELNTNWVVHHIDQNRSNNSLDNLLVFVDQANHKRFHNSKYAYLTYDEETHLFSSEIIKDKD